MKHFLRVLFTLLCISVCALLPILAFVSAWVWVMAQVPIGFIWTGLAKVALSIFLVLVFGSATFGLAILGGLLGGIICAILFDPS